MKFSGIIQIGILMVAAFLVAPVGSTSARWSNVAWNSNEPPNPSANIAPVPNVLPKFWNTNSPPICAQQGNIAQCDLQALQAINRAHSIEGIPPISLPADYSLLPFDVQQFIIVNLERTVYGLPPLVGITASLDTVAQNGAANFSDPTDPNSSLIYTSDESNWISVAGSNPLLADYGYMYEDGWGGSIANTLNLDCSSSGAVGCWGHRDSLLWNPGVQLSFGAGEGGPSGPSVYSTALIIAETTPSHGYIYTWAQYQASIASNRNPAGMCTGVIGTAVGASADTGGGGWIVGSNGSIETTGDAPCYGSLAGQSLNAPIVGIASTPDGKGYWLVASDGGVFAFGDATFYGSMGGKALNKPIVGIASTADGKGYWLVASDGGIFTFGDATFDGSMGGKPLNKPIVGMAADPVTGGYWEVASDGGIFSFNAPFFGSMGGKYLAKPIVGMDALGNGQGYRFVASDGGVFDFGDAGFLGSTGGQSLPAPVVGMGAAADGNGYWLVGGSGAVYSY